MRDPDAFMPADLGVRHELEALGTGATPAQAQRLAERWRPYRSYAVQHLWASLERRERDGDPIASPRRSRPSKRSRQLRLAAA
jgi:3-methyladenine DNA glycosylase/8-oxoguanine DNA glycosylase